MLNLGLFTKASDIWPQKVCFLKSKKYSKTWMKKSEWQWVILIQIFLNPWISQVAEHIGEVELGLKVPIKICRVWYSNGRFMFGCQMVKYSSHMILPFEYQTLIVSGIQMNPVLRCLVFGYLVFRRLLYNTFWNTTFH